MQIKYSVCVALFCGVMVGCVAPPPESPKDFELGDAVADGDIRKVETLLSQYPPSTCDRYGRPVLLVATAKNDEEILNVLLNHGANPEQKNARGKSPLKYAIDNRKGEAIKRFIRKGAKLSRKDAHLAMGILSQEDIGEELDFRILEAQGACKDIGLSDALKSLKRNSPVSSIKALLSIGAKMENDVLITLAREKKNIALFVALRDRGVFSRTELERVIGEILNDVPLSSFDKKEIESYREDGGKIEAVIMKIGVRYYRQARFSIAAPMLEIAADCGDTEAQRILGYRNGRKPDTSRISFKMRLAIKKAYDDD